MRARVDLRMLSSNISIFRLQCISILFLLQWLLLAYSRGLCVLWDLTSDEQTTEPARKYTDISKDEKMVKYVSLSICLFNFFLYLSVTSSPVHGGSKEAWLLLLPIAMEHSSPLTLRQEK